MYEKTAITVASIKRKINIEPTIGIILGTGLGGLATHVEDPLVLNYTNIPNFPVSTVEGHKGRLIFGRLGGKQVVVLQGRFHYYEGYTMPEVTFPIRVLKGLGIQRLFVSNASGGMDPEQEIGDLMIIRDHINLMPNPLVGKNDERLGVRFPDMSQPYDKDLIALAERVGEEQGLKLKKGVYVGTTGPTFETPAEYKYFRMIGGDAVGMSTVPEVIVARHAGIPVFGISIITDLGVEGRIVEVSHEEVRREGAKAELKMTELIKEMLARIELNGW